MPPAIFLTNFLMPMEYAYPGAFIFGTIVQNG